MGTWGSGILQNDTSADVYKDYIELLCSGTSCAAATKSIRASHAFEFTDRDTAADAWLAVALAQWEFGTLQPAALRRVQTIASGKGQQLWKEAGPAKWKVRQLILDAFLAKLSTPPQKPRAPELKKALTTLPAPFAIGDCLAIRLSDKTWGAAIVTGKSIDQLTSSQSVELNVIAQLDYKDKAVPKMAVFRTRKWLRLTHSTWGGRRAVWNIDARKFNTAKSNFIHVGSIAVRKSDPTSTDFFSDWKFAEHVRIEHAHRRSASRANRRNSL